jgi:subtilase family serine protease
MNLHGISTDAVCFCFSVQLSQSRSLFSMHFFAKISPAMLRPVHSTQSPLRFSLLALGLMTALGQNLSPARAADPRLALEPKIALRASIAPAPAMREAHLLGRLDSSATLRVGITLPLRNQSQLSDLLRRQYTPGDALYHKFLTPADFTARFGPTAQDYDAVAAYARAQGLTVTETSPGRTLLNVAGPSSRIETAFSVQMSSYRLPSGRLAFANTAAPLLPRSIAARVTGIVGLNNVAQMHPHLSRMRSNSPVSRMRSNAPLPITGGGGTFGSGPLGGLAPNDIKYAYDLNTITPLYGSSTPVPTGALDGTGQNIGLYEEDGFDPADIAQYAGKFALPTLLTGVAASVTTIPLGGFSGTPLTTPGQGGQTEVTLDIDMVLALAPAATGIYVYEDDENVDAAAPLTIFTRMANDLAPGSGGKPLLQVISCSWGNAEQLIDPSIIQGENTLFQQMAAQGQSLFCSSGDNGAYDLFDPNLPALTSPAVDNPSSQPFATGVGGTTLSYIQPATSAGSGTVTPGAYVGEIAWSIGTPAINPEGSGGGVSSIWPKPDYQIGAGASPTRRDVPDVSLNADPNTGYSIYVAGAAEVIGGTSAAAPLWAAYTALINQQRALNGLGTLGFLNPLIYPIGASSSYTTDFHDVTSGNNLFYQAGIGYDDVTGYGSFVGAPLLAALSFNANQGDGTATVSGLVTDSSVPPAPVVGATVSAISASTGSVAATTTTDATGAYTLAVPSGLNLKLTVGTGAITAPLTGPTTTESLAGQTLTLPALTADQILTEDFNLTASHIYTAGLQMISSPFDYTGIGDFATLFGLTEAQANLSPRLIQFSPLLNGYVFYPTAPADTLRLGQGYWVKFPSAAYLHVQGTPASTAQSFSIPLQPGWNQIGDPFTLSAPLSKITVVVSSGASGPLASSAAVQPTLYSFDLSTGQYVSLAPTTDPTTKIVSYPDDSVDALAPYAGYWVFAFQKSTLVVPAPAASGPPPVPGS